ncbi:MAG: hypothetical protein JKY53_06975 [Flavobacteriales bacterium]|nr:hypothetical protein [Flavobacteriales bacterium]
MATIRYLIQSASEQSSIYLQYSLGRGRVIKRRTGFTIDAKKWSSVKGLPILKDEVLKSLKIDLDTLKTKLEIAHNLAIKQGQDIDGIWLQKQIDLAHNKVPKVKLD